MTTTVHPVDEVLPAGKLTALGLQHVLVMYAGAVAVPLIVGRALKLSPEQVAMLISADLFCCGIVTLIQSLGATQWFGIKLPVMMGVTFASVAPMVAMANSNPGAEGAGLIFGAIIGAGIISILIAPLVSRMLRFFPPVVTGSIILVIGISLMRVGSTGLRQPGGHGTRHVPRARPWLAQVTGRGHPVRCCPRSSLARPKLTTPTPPHRRGHSRWCWSDHAEVQRASTTSRCCWASSSVLCCSHGPDEL
jgi:NCS2 family nucleobase:cation symporter-2